MSRADMLRADLARLAKKESDLHADLAEYLKGANKHNSDSTKKYEAASKSKSSSSASSYRRQGESSAKKAAELEKRASDVKKKLSRLASEIARKQKSLSDAEEAGRQKHLKEAERERRVETNHVRKIAAMRKAALIAPPKPEPLRVLYMTTNPEVFTDGVLRTDAEIRNVQNELRGTRYRDRVHISHLPAATYEDMLQGMNDKRPHVIHFSGHGGGAGILFDNGSVDNPEGVGMEFDKLGKFLSATDDPPRLLVLNACDTLNGAEVLLDAVPVVVAMSDSITDMAAAMFATKFYSAIASAQSVGSALKQAKAILSLLASAEDHLPQCIAREGVDVGSLILVTPD